MKTSNIFRQQGVTLVFSLVILVTLTMLGLTSMQRTTSELAMAGNQRESGMMFQSAEIGLASAEKFIDDSISNADFAVASKGLFTVVASDVNYKAPDYFDGQTWKKDFGAQASATHLSPVRDTLFKVEYLGDRLQNPNAALNIGDGYGGVSTGDIVSIYRSTARGVGLTGKSYRYIQSYFGKLAP